MAHTLEQLARQEQTLVSIHGIVRTMKTLAAINAAPYEQAATAIDGFRQTVRHGLAAFAWRMGNQVLTDSGAMQRQVLVVFGSDHGFCGNYNAVVARAAQHFLDAPGAQPGVVLCVGARLHDALADAGVPADQLLVPPASVDGIGRLAGDIVTRVEQLGRGAPLTRLAVQLAYTRRAGHAEREPHVATLLPLQRALLAPPRRWPGRSLPDFGMAPAALLAALLRHHVFASVFHAAAEALVTENAARLALMQQAEQSVEERLETVRRELSGVRQEQITEELMDIVIGHMQ
ncbi:MAG: F0F1 ATP synthase subunit gamma [Ottowia sp.]|nr:F0F1 ATP synthase subunit gamma [Ottowia sp.]